MLLPPRLSLARGRTARKSASLRRLLAIACSYTALACGALPAPAGPHIVVLGTAQDGSHPQAGCSRACCKKAWSDPRARHFVSSLGLVDPRSQKRWLFDATPDLPAQLHAWNPHGSPKAIVTGVFLTHAHIGHYAGLMHFGREVIGASGIDVYAMPRMRTFLETNGPWSQLVKLRNVQIVPMVDHQVVNLTDQIKVAPLLVPHRDEYTETVGFSIAGPTRRVLYIPDIDKWEKWSTPIEEAVAEHDVAFIDGTFFGASDLPNRTMAEVPHPFITESMQRFSKLTNGERAKIRFIHLNHSNPALDPGSREAAQVRALGFTVAVQSDVVAL